MPFVVHTYFYAKVAASCCVPFAKESFLIALRKNSHLLVVNITIQITFEIDISTRLRIVCTSISQECRFRNDEIYCRV